MSLIYRKITYWAEGTLKIFLCNWLLLLQSNVAFSHNGVDHNVPHATQEACSAAARNTATVNGILHAACCRVAGCDYDCRFLNTAAPDANDRRECASARQPAPLAPTSVIAPPELRPAAQPPTRPPVPALPPQPPAVAPPASTTPRPSRSSPVSDQPTSCPQPILTVNRVTKSCCSYRWDIFSTIDPTLGTHDLMLELDRRWLARSGSVQGDDFCAAIKTWRANYYRSGCSRTNAGTTTGRQRISTGVYRARIGACTCGNGSPGDYGGYFPNNEDRCANYPLRTTSDGTATGTRRNTNSNVLESVGESGGASAN